MAYPIPRPPLGLLLTLLLTIGVAGLPNSPVIGEPLTPTIRPTITTRPAVRSRLKFRVGVRPSKFRIGGFARSSFCEKGAKVTALVPPPGLDSKEQIIANQSPIDYTTSTHPTLWIHIPKLPPGTTAQFTIMKEGSQQREFYSTRFDTAEKSGIIGVQIPTSAPPLAIGTRYRWQVRILCPVKDELNLGSWVQRIDSNQLPRDISSDKARKILQQITTEKPEDRAPLYADLGLWQDAITAIAQLRLKNDKDPQLEQDWKDLLTQTKMEPSLLKEPILKIF
jgi:hypothetical protein